MSDFCIEALTPERNLRADHGILRIAALAVTSDARAAADQIMQRAQAQADALLADARVDAQQAVQQAEQATLQRADQLLQALQQTHATFLDRAQEMVLDLAQGLFDRLVIETTPRERIEAALKRVLLEAPPRLVDPLLRVHPDDADLLPAVEWDVKPDPSLSRGMCRLEASHGLWCVDFSAAVTALKAALTRAAGNAAANPGAQ
ncbi:MAG: hypothetical protein A3I66_12055 [Burkholderiales bacterium RIFCSPLOWO2_02_FULL_57_36]|nr:MAG: hypothetical protein A3I66_12055 [Burkholderiales bacterium RIFCSPLOWO2_02_FULL_57_36]